MPETYKPGPCPRCETDRPVPTVYTDYPPRMRLTCRNGACGARTRDVTLYLPPAPTVGEIAAAVESAGGIASMAWNSLGDEQPVGLVSS